jgi:hypothetical protein
MATAASDPGTGTPVTRLAMGLVHALTENRRPQSVSRLSFLWIAALVLRMAGASLLIWVGAIHVHLWSEGYRQIPKAGPLFLADAMGGFGLAAILLVWPRLLAGLLGVGYMLTTLAGLIISLNFGLLGFRESTSASFVAESMVLEILGAATLTAWMIVVGSQPPGRRMHTYGSSPGES